MTMAKSNLGGTKNNYLRKKPSKMKHTKMELLKTNLLKMKTKNQRKIPQTRINLIFHIFMV